MEKRVIHEVRLSKPLMAVAIIAVIGLFAIGLRPVIEATPAFADGHITHKVKIVGGQIVTCEFGKVVCD